MSKDNQYDLDLDISDITVDDDVLGASSASTFTISIDDTISYNNSYSSYSFGDYTYNPGVDITAGDLTVHQEGDIKLGDLSLKDFIEKVEERMNILRPNPELEEQWNELKKLGDAYRKLEKELLEKNKVWEALKN